MTGGGGFVAAAPVIMKRTRLFMDCYDTVVALCLKMSYNLTCVKR